MYLDLNYFSFFILFLIAFLVVTIIYIKKVSIILVLSNTTELKRAEDTIRLYLLIAVIMSLLSVVFLAFALFKPQVPLIINFPVEYFYFRSIVYQSELNLLYDTLLIVIVVVLLNICLIIRSQSKVGSCFEFWSGFIFGCVFIYTLQPIFVPLFVTGIVIILLLFILSLLRFGIKETMNYIGFLTGIIFMVIFSPVLGNFVFWLFLAFGIGIVVGSFYLFGLRLFILAVPSLPIIILVFLSNVTLSATLLFGIFIVMMFILELKEVYKAAVVALGSFIYILLFSAYPAIFFAIALIVGLSFTQLFIAELYKRAMRTIFIKWISLQSISNSILGKINLSKHHMIPNFEKSSIDTKSYRFKWLDYLILEPLKSCGFKVEIIKEKRNKLEYIYGVFVKLK